MNSRSNTFLVGASIVALALIALLVAPVTDSASGPSRLGAPPHRGDNSTGRGTLSSGPGLGSADFAALELTACQLPNQTFETVGVAFERAPARLATTGPIQVAALFVDFPDGPAVEEADFVLEANWPQAKDYLASVSNGRSTVELTQGPDWMRLSKPSAEYQIEEDGAAAFDAAQVLLKEAVALADPTFDFTGIDVVIVFTDGFAPNAGQSFAVLEGLPNLGIAAEGGSVVLPNVIFRGTDGLGGASSGFNIGEAVVAHEMLHTYGLADLYVDDPDTTTPYLHVGNFDPMSSIEGFNPTEFPLFSTLRANELFAWHAWMLGWIDDNQVLCGEETVHQTTLSPAHVPGGTKALVVRTGPSRVLVAEARTPERWDAELSRSGVLVYTVDSSVLSGEGPIRVQRAGDIDIPDGSVLLQPGEDITVDGFRIQADASDGLSFGVTAASTTCGDEPVTIDMSTGASGIGTSGDDVILGTPGNDFIDAGAGNDLVCAGPGDDVVLGGTGDDQMFGESGRDVMRGGPGVDLLRGGLGNDRLLGGIGDDTMTGDEGDDYLGGYGGHDIIFGGAGDDIVFGGFGRDAISGGDGHDEIHGLIGNDEIFGDAGNDVLDGDRGSDIISGGDGADIIRGGNAPDLLFGDKGDDDISGGKGDDEMAGGDGNDLCVGNKQSVRDFADSTCELAFGIP